MTDLVMKLPFSGFYESVHDEMLDHELASMFEDDEGNIPDEDCSLYEKICEAIDWTKVHESYAKSYTEMVWEITDIPMEFESLTSPKFYNYETDRIFVTITPKTAKKLYAETPIELLTKHIAETFEPRSGFIPHYSDKLSEWNSDFLAWDHNELGTLFEAWLLAHNLAEEVMDYYKTDYLYEDIEAGTTPELEKLYVLRSNNN